MKNKLFSLIVLCPMLLIALFLFVFNTNSNYIFADAVPAEIKIISDTAKVYELADLNATVLKTAVFSEKYNVESISGGFYEIQIPDLQNGYVLTSYCMDSLLKPIQSFLDTNAVITAESGVYIKNGAEYEAVSSVSLAENTRVKLLSGADNSNVYSFITFSLNGENLTYYVLSDNIDADGFSLRTLVALMLIVTCVALFLIIYSFYRNKKHK